LKGDICNERVDYKERGESLQDLLKLFCFRELDKLLC